MLVSTSALKAAKEDLSITLTKIAVNAHKVSLSSMEITAYSAIFHIIGMPRKNNVRLVIQDITLIPKLGIAKHVRLDFSLTLKLISAFLFAIFRCFIM